MPKVSPQDPDEFVARIVRRYIEDGYPFDIIHQHLVMAGFMNAEASEIIRKARRAA